MWLTLCWKLIFIVLLIDHRLIDPIEEKTKIWWWKSPKISYDFIDDTWSIAVTDELDITIEPESLVNDIVSAKFRYSEINLIWTTRHTCQAHTMTLCLYAIYMYIVQTMLVMLMKSGALYSRFFSFFVIFIFIFVQPFSRECFDTEVTALFFRIGIFLLAQYNFSLLFF